MQIRDIVGSGKHQQEALASREAVRDWIVKALDIDANINLDEVLLDKQVQIQLSNNTADVLYNYIVTLTWSKRNG